MVPESKEDFPWEKPQAEWSPEQWRENVRRHDEREVEALEAQIDSQEGASMCDVTATLLPYWYDRVTYLPGGAVKVKMSWRWCLSALQCLLSDPESGYEATGRVGSVLQPRTVLNRDIWRVMPSSECKEPLKLGDNAPDFDQLRIWDGRSDGYVIIHAVRVRRVGSAAMGMAADEPEPPEPIAERPGAAEQVKQQALEMLKQIDEWALLEPIRQDAAAKGESERAALEFEDYKRVLETLGCGLTKPDGEGNWKVTAAPVSPDYKLKPSSGRSGNGSPLWKWLCVRRASSGVGLSEAYDSRQKAACILKWFKESHPKVVQLPGLEDVRKAIVVAERGIRSNPDLKFTRK